MLQGGQFAEDIPTASPRRFSRSKPGRHAAATAPPSRPGKDHGKPSPPKITWAGLTASTALTEGRAGPRKDKNPPTLERQHDQAASQALGHAFINFEPPKQASSQPRHSKAVDNAPAARDPNPLRGGTYQISYKAADQPMPTNPNEPARWKKALHKPNCSLHQAP